VIRSKSRSTPAAALAALLASCSSAHVAESPASSQASSAPISRPATSVAPPSSPDAPPKLGRPRRPRIVPQPVTFSSARLAQTAAYARRHYGVSTTRLRPKLIVLHFTASGSGSEPGVHALFESDQPNGGELPGVCAHFIVDQDGTIYQQAPLTVICRHAIGVNDHAIGIEMVQAQGPSSHWADLQILHRRPQIQSVLRLVRWLQSRYGIANGNVIGHAMANDSPYFHDREGWRNDHSDWQAEDVRLLRRML
jgi:N-acetylmuramoyl-L-alanine amidase-like protein